MSKEQFEMNDKGLLVRSPAKINLSLLIAGKRPDGFHEIRTLMAKVSLYDDIYIEPRQTGAVRLECLGNYDVPADDDNLVLKAVRLLENYCNTNISADITLFKRIPPGAGLGGGSSNAASVMMAINKIYKLGLNQNVMAKLSSQIGSDIPFFFGGPLSFCSGKGEKITKISKNFDFLALLLLPDINSSTKEVYGNYSHDEAVFQSLNEQINTFLGKKRIDLVTKMCANMLEAPSYMLYEKLADIKKFVQSQCSEPVCLSGSGSTIYILFDPDQIERVLELQQAVINRLGCQTEIVSNNRW